MKQGDGHQRPRYTEAQTRHWLAWLAGGMQRHGQTLFQLEQLQPDWLGSHLQLQVYILSTRLIGGIGIGLATATIVGIGVGLAMGVLSGITIGVVEMLGLTSRRLTGDPRGNASVLDALIGVVVIGLPVWFLGWLVGLWIGDRHFGFSIGWMFGAVFFVTYGLRRHGPGFSRDIRTVEALSWSWRRATLYALLGVGIGFVVGLTAELSGRLIIGRAMGVDMAQWIEMLVLVGSLVGLCGLIFGGLDSGVIETKTAPNQGIRLSFRNAIFAGAIAGCLLGIAGAVVAYVSGRVLVALTGLPRLQEGFNYALPSGILVALWYGGIDILQHYILRVVLFVGHFAPTRFARFLDYAVEELHFLQRVGGGYMFVHRYLLEHFAGLEQLPSVSSVNGKRSRGGDVTSRPPAA